MIGSEKNNVILWATKNIMSINTNKSKILIFRRKSPHNCILPQEFFGITCCQNIKLLGITFNEALDFNEHFHAVVKKASQRLYFLRVTKPCLSKKELWKIYFAHIRSILEYGAPLFSSLSKNLSATIEKVQRRAHLIICGAHCRDCSFATLSERRVELSSRLFGRGVGSI